MMVVVYFKIILVKSLIGPNLAGVPDARPEHKFMHSESRKQCAYCAMFSKSKRTRFKFCDPSCNIPLCCLGSSVTEDDCFANSHSNDRILQATHAKYVQIKAKTSKRCNDL